MDLLLDRLNIPAEVAEILLNLLENGKGVRTQLSLDRDRRDNGGLLAQVTTNLFVKRNESLLRGHIIFIPKDLQTNLELTQGSFPVPNVTAVGHDHPVGIFVCGINLENLVRDFGGVFRISLGKLPVHHLLEQFDVHLLEPFPLLDTPPFVAPFEEGARVERGDLLEREGHRDLVRRRTVTLLVQSLQPEDIKCDLGVKIEADPVGLGLNQWASRAQVAGLDDLPNLPEGLAEILSSLILLRISPERRND